MQFVRPWGPTREGSAAHALWRGKQPRSRLSMLVLATEEEEEEEEEEKSSCCARAGASADAGCRVVDWWIGGLVDWTVSYRRLTSADGPPGRSHKTSAVFTSTHTLQNSSSTDLDNNKISRSDVPLSHLTTRPRHNRLQAECTAAVIGPAVLQRRFSPYIEPWPDHGSELLSLRPWTASVKHDPTCTSVGLLRQDKTYAMKSSYRVAAQLSEAISTSRPCGQASCRSTWPTSTPAQSCLYLISLPIPSRFPPSTFPASRYSPTSVSPCHLYPQETFQSST
jgi:hypothetical protein